MTKKKDKRVMEEDDRYSTIQLKKKTPDSLYLKATEEKKNDCYKYI